MPGESGTPLRAQQAFATEDESITLEESGVSQFVRLMMMAACLVVVVFVAWAAITRVDEVAVAHGEVVPSGSVRVVQHLEGGIIADILVEEGTLVDAGGALVKVSRRNRAAQIVHGHEETRAFIGQYDGGRAGGFTGYSVRLLSRREATGDKRLGVCRYDD